MTAQEVLTTLKKLGKPQTAAIYKCHGSGANILDPSKLTRADADRFAGDPQAHFLFRYLSDLVARSAIGGAERVPGTIEKQIHASSNSARYAMNGALIAIGINKPKLRKKATEAAGRIGNVDVDHGETTCKTRDAIPCIDKAAKRTS